MRRLRRSIFRKKQGLLRSVGKVFLQRKVLFLGDCLKHLPAFGRVTEDAEADIFDIFF